MSMLLGFDFGSNKIGVAIGQTITKQARALTVINANNGVPNWQQIDILIKQYNPNTLVIGLPINMDDSISDISLKAQKFARQLNSRFNIPVQMWDERLSSFEARGLLKATKKNNNNKTNQKNQNIDAIAAALILQGFLDSLDNISFQST